MLFGVGIVCFLTDVRFSLGQLLYHLGNRRKRKDNAETLLLTFQVKLQIYKYNEWDCVKHQLFLPGSQCIHVNNVTVSKSVFLLSVCFMAPVSFAQRFIADDIKSALEIVALQSAKQGSCCFSYSHGNTFLVTNILEYSIEIFCSVGQCNFVRGKSKTGKKKDFWLH